MLLWIYLFCLNRCVRTIRHQFLYKLQFGSCVKWFMITWLEIEVVPYILWIVCAVTSLPSSHFCLSYWKSSFRVKLIRDEKDEHQWAPRFFVDTSQSAGSTDVFHTDFHPNSIRIFKTLFQVIDRIQIEK